ncbi:MAG: hypothetical protein Q4G26_14905, partial [Paracoccus sp. (in: a-proteobacteria)]|nr:hypothetical protein [Paracoccus sp. (in: a-proteobacteria)]
MAALASAGTGVAGGGTAQAQGIGAAAGLADLEGLPAAGAGPVWLAAQGWFAPAPADDDAPADGILRVEGSDGHIWQRMGFAGSLDPAWFRAPDDGADDAAALQRAFDFAALHGPMAVQLGARRYDCRRALSADPTRLILQGLGAVLDFTAMPAPAETPPLLGLADLPPMQGWHHDGGALTRDEAPAGTLSHPLSLPDPGRYRVRILIDALSGHADYPAVTIAIRDPQGEAVAGLIAASPGFYDFEITGPGSFTLDLGTDCAIRISRLDITHEGLRECLLIRAGENSPQYGHLWTEGITLRGPGIGTTLDGMRFETMAEARSSRLEMRNITVEGFRAGLTFSHRAYLIRALGLRVACETGLHFLGGSRDAGELISLYGATLEAARVAIRNNGGEIALFGTAIDFVDQIFVGSGRLMLEGCHLEINRPKAADLPPFDLGHGDITISSGSFMVTGNDFEAGNQCDHIFTLRARGATASMRDVSIYNLRSQSGALAGGSGRLDVARLRGGRPRHMAPIVQFAPGRNLLGPLPLDLGEAPAPDAPLTPRPAPENAFQGSPDAPFIAVTARAIPGAELGLSFRIRSDTPGTVWVTAVAVSGKTRTRISDSWPVEVTPEWHQHMFNSASTHPDIASGRMPDGWPGVALFFDQSALTGPVDYADLFLCAC